jgi:hypothetical protein
MAGDPRRRALLGAALGFLLLDRAPAVPALATLHRYMDSWAGIGRVVVALDRDGYKVTLSKIAAGEWRVTFHRDAMTSVDGYGVAATPWRATQRAAWAILNRAA